VSENRVLRRIFGPNRDQVKEGQRKLLNGELHDLYSSPSIIRIIKLRMMRWAGHVAGMPEEKKPLGGPRGRWVDNININIGLVQRRIGTSGELLSSAHLHSQSGYEQTFRRII
jgi:hypothetical protein